MCARSPPDPLHCKSLCCITLWLSPTGLHSKELLDLSHRYQIHQVSAELRAHPCRRCSRIIRFASRSLIKAPGFSCVVIISIALAFAANATVFSVANGLLWGVLPVKDSQNVVMFSEGRSFSYPDYASMTTTHNPGTSSTAASLRTSLSSRRASVAKRTPERIWGQAVKAESFFSTLQTRMMLGRPILPDDDRVLGSGNVSLAEPRFMEAVVQRKCRDHQSAGNAERA